jgi:hypothetical protein
VVVSSRALVQILRRQVEVQTAQDLQRKHVIHKHVPLMDLAAHSIRASRGHSLILQIRGHKNYGVVPVQMVEQPLLAQKISL